MCTHIVSFKEEGFFNGQPYGPVKVVDVAARNADPEYDPESMFAPYGKIYAGETVYENWMSRAEAAAIAAEHGVELTE